MVMAEIRRTLAGIITLAALSGACTLQSPDVPPLTGPSTLALSLTAAASPDILPEDGVSQSVIRITARDQFGQVRPDVALRVDTVIGGAIVDLGTLSARNVTTNAAGEATVTFTAPLARFRGVDTGTVVRIEVRPVGTDFLGSALGTVTSIRLVPESVAFDPGAPIPSFTFTPANPKVEETIFFNASGSSDPGGFIVSYAWTFSDGHTGEFGANVSHDFQAAGNHFVTLTVTDNEGKSSSFTRLVTVAP